MKIKILIAAFCWCNFYVKAQNTNHGTGAGNAGTNNTSIGAYAGDVVTGTNNVFMGWRAGHKTTSQSQNTFIGGASGFENTLGRSNTFIGSYSGQYNTTGTNNNFIGSHSGSSNTTGSYNCFFGGGNTTTGNSNVAIGWNSLTGNFGNRNIIIGYDAGPHYIPSTSSDNVMIGYQSGKNSNNNGNKNIFLGYQAGYNETGSDKLYIENSSSSTPLIYGDFATDKVGINVLPVGTHTLSVGGTLHATGIYVNGQSITDAGFEFWTKAGNNVWNNTGNVGIGTNLANNPHNYKLAVKGKLGAHEVQIENNSLTWSDFVFYDDYELMSLQEVERFIKTHKHLPGIPSEKEVKENGILLGEMNAKLLQKIEELTLYVIELQKEVEALKKSK